MVPGGLANEKGNAVGKKKLRNILIIVSVFLFCMVLLACSPQTNTSGSNDPDTGAETEFSWTPDANCAMCHDNSVKTLAKLSCEAAQGDPSSTCMTCHADAKEVEAAHKEVTLADTEGDQKYLKASRVPMKTCLACHNLEELAVATAGNTALADDRGTIVNPHEVMTVTNINGAHDEASCANCHKIHSDKDTIELASDYCLTCHHDNIYECNTCH